MTDWERVGEVVGEIEMLGGRIGNLFQRDDHWACSIYRVVRGEPRGAIFGTGKTPEGALAGALGLLKEELVLEAPAPKKKRGLQIRVSR